jgi:hypothetical protein
LPTLIATATILNATYPYAQTLSTTWLGIGNPAMPNSTFRVYILTNNTNGSRYRITTVKKASTGEILGVQNGVCDILVEKIF